jgi:hypothetical protein
MRDGSLDFDDDVLADLDYVVASVHSGFGMPEAEMTERVIRAISNPYVTMLAHPTGRLLLRREPYAIDIPAVIEAAAATGTWIEINAAPKRLDLGLALVAAREGEGREVRHQSRRARRGALAGAVVRHRRRAQRLAHESRRDEHAAARQDRGGIAAQAHRSRRALIQCTLFGIATGVCTAKT